MLKACACAGEQGSRGAGEQGSRGEFNVPSSIPSAPLHFKLVRNAGITVRMSTSKSHTKDAKKFFASFCYIA
ncbi:hypothetical protein CDG79_19225 [Nostoc sp. 'Peltigera membranacea cyanobiont' 232]|nr:hypothetical protein CDG79_19225 [Nostoc sp. 'Peltigera membranacea cyanobiont' 232]